MQSSAPIDETDNFGPAPTFMPKDPRRGLKRLARNSNNQIAELALGYVDTLNECERLRSELAALRAKRCSFKKARKSHSKPTPVPDEPVFDIEEPAPAAKKKNPKS